MYICESPMYETTQVVFSSFEKTAFKDSRVGCERSTRLCGTQQLSVINMHMETMFPGKLRI